MKTIRVRIAVAINNDGHWNAMGFYRWDDKESADTALEGLDEVAHCEMLHYVEVEIPIPRPLTFTGTVAESATVEESP